MKTRLIYYFDRNLSYTETRKAICLPCITCELSFKKKLYRYLGIKADMHA